MSTDTNIYYAPLRKSYVLECTNKNTGWKKTLEQKQEQEYWKLGCIRLGFFYLALSKI